MKRSHTIALAFLITLQILVNYFTIVGSRLLYLDADAWHLHEATRYCHIVTDKNSGGLLEAVNAAAITGLHPQLYQFTLGLLTSPAPPARPEDFDLPVLLLNSIFFILLAFSVYRIGRLLYGPNQGLLAAALVSFCPAVFGQMRLPLLEFPLAALVSFSLYLLLETGDFRSRRMSLLTGIAFGLAQLTKETAVVFIFPVFLAYSLRALSSKEQRPIRMANCAIILLTAVSVAGVVYLNPHNLKMYFGIREQLLANKYPDALFYLKAFPYFYLGIWAFPACLPLLIRYILMIRKRNTYIALWLFCPLLLFTFAGFKAARFMIPAMPALFLLISGEAFSPFFRRARLAYPALLTALFAFQYLQLNFFFDQDNRHYRAYAVNKTGLLTAQTDGLVPTAERIASFIDQGTPDNKVNLIYISNFRYNRYVQLLLDLKKINYRYFELKEPLAVGSWTEKCANADFLFEEVNQSGESRKWILDSNEYKKCRDECLPFFTPAGEFPSLSKDGRPATLHVYKRKTKPRPY